MSYGPVYHQEICWRQRSSCGEHFKQVKLSFVVFWWSLLGFSYVIFFLEASGPWTAFRFPVLLDVWTCKHAHSTQRDLKFHMGPAANWPEMDNLTCTIANPARYYVPNREWLRGWRWPSFGKDERDFKNNFEHDWYSACACGRYYPIVCAWLVGH